MTKAAHTTRPDPGAASPAGGAGAAEAWFGGTPKHVSFTMMIHVIPPKTTRPTPTTTVDLQGHHARPGCRITGGGRRGRGGMVWRHTETRLVHVSCSHTNVSYGGYVGPLYLEEHGDTWMMPTSGRAQKRARGVPSPPSIPSPPLTIMVAPPCGLSVFIT